MSLVNIISIKNCNKKIKKLYSHLRLDENNILHNYQKISNYIKEDMEGSVKSSDLVTLMHNDGLLDIDKIGLQDDIVTKLKSSLQETNRKQVFNKIVLTIQSEILSKQKILKTADIVKTGLLKKAFKHIHNKLKRSIKFKKLKKSIDLNKREILRTIMKRNWTVSFK